MESGGIEDHDPVGHADDLFAALDATDATPLGVGSRPLQFDVLKPAPESGTTRARLGRLATAHGVVETPVFMPVGTGTHR